MLPYLTNAQVNSSFNEVCTTIQAYLDSDSPTLFRKEGAVADGGCFVKNEFVDNIHLRVNCVRPRFVNASQSEKANCGPFRFYKGRYGADKPDFKMIFAVFCRSRG